MSFDMEFLSPFGAKYARHFVVGQIPVRGSVSRLRDCQQPNTFLASKQLFKHRITRARTYRACLSC